MIIVVSDFSVALLHGKVRKTIYVVPAVTLRKTAKIRKLLESLFGTRDLFRDVRGGGTKQSQLPEKRGGATPVLERSVGGAWGPLEGRFHLRTSRRHGRRS